MKAVHSSTHISPLKRKAYRLRWKISRLLVKLFQRNSVRLAGLILFVQIVYILLQVDHLILTRPHSTSQRDPQDIHIDQYNLRTGTLWRKGRKQKYNDHGYMRIAFEEDYDSLGGHQDDTEKRRLPSLVINQTPLPTQLPYLRLVPLHIQRKSKPSSNRKKAVHKPKGAHKRIIALCSMKERAAHVSTYCNQTITGDERLNNYKKTRYGPLLVDDKHKVIYCDIPNVMTVMWNTFIAKATGRVNNARPPVRNRNFMTKIGLRYLDSYSDEDRSSLLGEYFKFLVVRHPLERLELIWRQKFIESSPQESWRRKLGKQIIMKQRGGFSNITEIPSNLTVRFEEFLEFAFADRDMLDPSWFSYLQVCHPCDVQYDAILRSESIDNELDLVLEHFEDLEDAYAMLNYRINPNPALDILAGNNHMRQFENVSIGAEEAILKRYHHDMRMFGYTWNSRERTLLCGISTPTGRVCC